MRTSYMYICTAITEKNGSNFISTNHRHILLLLGEGDTHQIFLSFYVFNAKLNIMMWRRKQKGERQSTFDSSPTPPWLAQILLSSTSKAEADSLSTATSLGSQVKNASW